MKTMKLNREQKKEYLDAMVTAYVECMLWATTDTGPDGDEIRYDEYEPSKALLAQARRDCREFLRMAGPQVYGYDAMEVGHDLWLTRERHGTGFWDRGMDPYYTQDLTKIAHDLGRIDRPLYLSRGKVMAG